MTEKQMATNQIIEIVEGDGIAKETKRPYYFVDININGLQITRLFPKDTERTYFKTLIGQYLKMSD